jgi:hypothetical protein
VLVQLAHSTVVGYYRSQVQHLQRRSEGYHSGSKHSYSNFSWHLRRNHEDEYKKASGTERPNQSSLNNNVNRSKKMTEARKEHCWLRLFAKKNLPLTILQREGFRDFMSAAVPEYKIPSYENNMVTDHSSIISDESHRRFFYWRKSILIE